MIYRSCLNFAMKPLRTAPNEHKKEIKGAKIKDRQIILSLLPRTIIISLISYVTTIIIFLLSRGLINNYLAGKVGFKVNVTPINSLSIIVILLVILLIDLIISFKVFSKIKSLSQEK